MCDSEGIQTPNLLIRSQMLYSVELRSRFAGAKIRRQFDRCKFLKIFYNMVFETYANVSMSFIPQNPFLPAVNSAAITAPSASPRRFFASCLMLIVSTSDS